MDRQAIGLPLFRIFIEIVKDMFAKNHNLLYQVRLVILHCVKWPQLDEMDGLNCVIISRVMETDYIAYDFKRARVRW